MSGEFLPSLSKFISELAKHHSITKAQPQFYRDLLNSVPAQKARLVGYIFSQLFGARNRVVLLVPYIPLCFILTNVTEASVFLITWYAIQIPWRLSSLS